MRKLVIAASAVALAVPAAASAQPRPDTPEIVDPRAIEDAGRMMDRLLAAILDMPIGPLIDAVDPQRRGRYDSRDRTVRDMASRDDPRFEEKMRGSVRGITAGMGTLAEQLAVIAPAMRRSLEDMERRVDDAIRRAEEDARRERARR